jgi:hypothetical protein
MLHPFQPMEDRMRTLSVAIAVAALLAVGSIAWNAQAQTSRGAALLGAQNYSPIVEARCGPSPHCGFGHKWRCDRHGHCHCVPC